MTTLAEELAWHDQASYRDHDSALWFPHGAPLDAVLAICTSCPVRSNCLEWAMQRERNWHHNMRAGIYGGYTARGRAQLAGCRAGTCGHTDCPEVR